MSLKLFDQEEELIWNSKLLENIDYLRVEEFVPRGQTALLDALGNTLKYFMDKRLKQPDSFTSCLVYLATDGYENCSKNFNKQQIKQMIETAKNEYNIHVLYLGANQDAILEASTLGIDPTQAINYNEHSETTEAVYRAVGRIASTQRMNPTQDIEFTIPERQSSQPANSVQPNRFEYTLPSRQNTEFENDLYSPPKVVRQPRFSPISPSD